MAYALSKDPDGRAWIMGSDDAKGSELGDYERELAPDEIVDGKRVRDFPVGTTAVVTPPPEPRR
jgi:hypothetical protein